MASFPKLVLKSHLLAHAHAHGFQVTSPYLHLRLPSPRQVSGGVGALSEVDLSGDFDPEKWDERMAELFNDDVCFITYKS